MPQDWEILLASLFKREIDLSRLKNMILQDMNSVYSPLELFELVDLMNQGYLDHISLKNFLLWNEHFPTNEELIAIIRRIDTNGDSKIDYDDFVQFIAIGYSPETYNYQNDHLEENMDREEYLNSETGINIDTSYPTYQVDQSTIDIETKSDRKDPSHSYKSVRFAPDHSALNIHDLSYSLTNENSFEYTPFHQKPSSPSPQPLKHPRSRHHPSKPSKPTKSSKQEEKRMKKLYKKRSK